MAGFQFGSISSIGSITGTLSIIAVAVFLVFFEKITELLELLEEASPSTYEMVQKVYKELMIMGLVSFLIVMFNTTDYAESANSVVLAVDYCHIALFFMALLFITHAFLLIRLSRYLATQYELYHFTDIKQLLEAANTQKSSYQQFCFNLEFIPGLQLRRQIELKVLSIFFHRSFGLPYDFVFSDYLSGCFEKYALELIDIGPMTWMWIIILSLLNLGRITMMEKQDLLCEDAPYGYNSTSSYGSSYSSSYGSSSYSSEARKLGAEATITKSDQCLKESLQVFLTGAFMLVCFCIFLVLLSRVYEIRLLRRAGASSLDASIAVLTQESDEITELTRIEEEEGEEALHKKHTHLGKLSPIELKKNIEMLTHEKHMKERHEKRRAVQWILSTFDRITAPFVDFFTCCCKVRRNLKKVVAAADHLKPLSSPDNSHKPTAAKYGANKGSLAKIRQATLQDMNSNSNRANNSASRSKTHQSNARGRVDEDEVLAVSANAQEKHAVNKELKLEEDLTSIFLFSSKSLFFHSVEFALMLNCMYMAFMSTSFWTIASQTSDPDTYHAALLFPLLITFPCLGMMVSSSSKIKAISQLNVEIIARVLQEDEETEHIMKELRAKMYMRIDETLGGQQRREALRIIFEELDSDNNEVIYKSDFWRLLRVLDLHYSNDKFNRMFRLIDIDKNGCISVEEFVDMIFPSHVPDDITLPELLKLGKKDLKERRRRQSQRHLLPENESKERERK